MEKKEKFAKMAESVKVIVRCRPMNDREKGLKCKVRWSVWGKSLVAKFLRKSKEPVAPSC